MFYGKPEDEMYFTHPCVRGSAYNIYELVADENAPSGMNAKNLHRHVPAPLIELRLAHIEASAKSPRHVVVVPVAKRHDGQFITRCWYYPKGADAAPLRLQAIEPVLRTFVRMWNPSQDMEIRLLVNDGQIESELALDRCRKAWRRLRTAGKKRRRPSRGLLPVAVHPEIMEVIEEVDTLDEAVPHVMRWLREHTVIRVRSRDLRQYLRFCMPHRVGQKAASRSRPEKVSEA
jgi:hypothetical protein